MVRTVEHEAFGASNIRGLRGQTFTTQGPKVNCVKQVDVS
jgi:hypothetical protein